MAGPPPPRVCRDRQTGGYGVTAREPERHTLKKSSSDLPFHPQDLTLLFQAEQGSTIWWKERGREKTEETVEEENRRGEEVEGWEMLSAERRQVECTTPDGDVGKSSIPSLI